MIPNGGCDDSSVTVGSCKGLKIAVMDTGRPHPVDRASRFVHGTRGLHPLLHLALETSKLLDACDIVLPLLLFPFHATLVGLGSFGLAASGSAATARCLWLGKLGLAASDSAGSGSAAVAWRLWLGAC